MPGLARVNWEQAKRAVAAVAPRVTDVLRSVRDPKAPALGEWNVAELATHLMQVWEVLPRLAWTDSMDKDLPPQLEHIGELGEFTVAMVDNEPERDLRVLANRIEAAAAEFTGAIATAKGDKRCPWLVEGSTVSLVTLVCHVLNESLMHGYDLARAGRRPWVIERSHAALALMGFIFPVLDMLDSRSLVDQEEAAGLRVCYDVRLRGGGQVFFVFTDGELTVEGPSSRTVDCHLWADPVALLLVVWARQSQWGPIATGRLVAWGRRPWLGLKLRRLMKNP